MIQIIDNIDYRGTAANFDRDSFDTVEAMREYRDEFLNDGHLSYCKETGRFYVFNSSNEDLFPVGKWRELWTTYGGLVDSTKVQDFLTRCSELIADRATADADGNEITATYVTKDTLKTFVYDVMQNVPLMLNILEGQIVPEMLSESVWELFETNGKHVAVPDEEDITTVNHEIKFANKQYEPTMYSGKGRKYLRKNMIAGVNILTSNQIDQENTIYVILYDFDLNGKTIVIPDNCMLKFEGGSITNGTLFLTNTSIQPNGCVITDYITADIQGKYAIGQCLYDTENGKPIYYNGSTWTDATGAEI